MSSNEPSLFNNQRARRLDVGQPTVAKLYLLSKFNSSSFDQPEEAACRKHLKIMKTVFPVAALDVSINCVLEGFTIVP